MYDERSERIDSFHDLYLEGISETDTGERNLLLLREAAKQCCGKVNYRITIPKGVYILGDAKTRDDFDDIMSGVTDPRSVWKDNYLPYNKCMYFEDIEGLEIDGQGSTLIFDGLIQPFGFNCCRNIMIKNLKMDWRRPLFTEGRVVSIKGHELDVEIFDGYPVNGGEPVISFQNFDPFTGTLGGVCPFTDISVMAVIRPGVVRIKSSEARFVKPGQVLIMRHIYNYRPGFDLCSCRDVTFENVYIHAVPGVGVFGMRTKDITFRQYKVVPSWNRIMSGNIDATHFISCYGNIVFDGCHFEGMGDDAANVHGMYYSIAEILDERTVRAFIAHQFSPNEKYCDFPDVGDELLFVKMDTLCPYEGAVVLSSRFDNTANETIIQFDRPLPGEFKTTDLLANRSKCAKLHFLNCIVRNVRGRAILIQTHGAVVENNIFEHCTGQGVHVDTAYPWMESIGTKDVIIKNNRFINCGYGTTGYSDAIGVVVETECNQPSIGVHQNLIIENNLIIGGYKPGVFLSCVEGAIIRENRIINSGPAIIVEYAANVSITGNNTTNDDIVIGEGCLKESIIVG